MLMTRLLFFSSFCADPLAFPRGASITESLVTTNHSCSLPHAPPPKKNGLSFLWLNSIPSTWTCIDRDSSGRERHSSRFSCRRRLSRSGLCVCMAAAQICLGDARKRWWERNVIGKAIEHLSLHQAPCDYDPPPTTSTTTSSTATSSCVSVRHSCSYFVFHPLPPLPSLSPAHLAEHQYWQF